jgi:hypothetical protein
MSSPRQQRDFYQRLLCHENASQEEIELSFKRLAMKHHPDRGGEEGDMKAINEAYEVLRDRRTRALYDSMRRQIRAAPIIPYRPEVRSETTRGWIAGTLILVSLGTFLLLLSRFQALEIAYVLLTTGLLLILIGLIMARTAIAQSRRHTTIGHSRKYIWFQETFFWAFVGGVIYATYFVFTGI